MNQARPPLLTPAGPTDQESSMQNKSVEKRVTVTSVHWEESVSTWVDGEAPIRPEELDSPYGRQLWDTYHLIGDVMRSQELAIKPSRSEEHTSELQSRGHLVCRLLLEKKNKQEKIV